MTQILALDPAQYARHALHGPDRAWVETNCYVDIWIELLHAWGFEPLAALPFTLGLDFEGDQWTFFKFPFADLQELYGLEVQELAVWRPLVRHVEEQLALGRPVLVELDSYYLPDTAGTAYRREHVKSTVAINEIDVAGTRLGYFHGQGYYQLQGEDFTKVFHLQGPADPRLLPPYVEFVRRRPRSRLSQMELVRRSLRCLRRQLARLPDANPFERFRFRLETDLPWLATEPIDTFHLYSFATLRQFGAAYELTASYLRWLQRHDVPHLAQAIAAFADLSTGAKTLQFRLARAVGRRKPLDLSILNELGQRWQTGVTQLKSLFLNTRNHRWGKPCANQPA